MGLSIGTLPIDCLKKLIQEYQPKIGIEKIDSFDETAFDNITNEEYQRVLEEHIEIQCQIAQSVLCGGGNSGIIYSDIIISVKDYGKISAQVKLLRSYFDSVSLAVVGQQIYGYFVCNMKAAALIAYEKLKSSKRLNQYVEFSGEKCKERFTQPFSLYICHNDNITSISNDLFVSYFAAVVRVQGFTVVPLVGFDVNKICEVNLINKFFSSFKTSYIVSHDGYAVSVFVLNEDGSYVTIKNEQ